MKKFFFARTLCLMLCVFSFQVDARNTIDEHATVENAFARQQNDVQIRSYGKVEKILADDNQGSRHQRFILRINATITVLVAHNIDIAKRIPDLKEGDRVEFYGEYVWNKKGGVVHWTHHDPAGRHLAGWLKHNGITYQ